MPIINPLTYNIANGQAVDAVPLMADLNQIVSNVNANAAALAGSSSQVFNVANATTSTEAVALGQAQAGGYNYAADTGAANAYAMALTPAPAAITPGMLVGIRGIVAANSGASTFNLNGLGALPIQGPGAAALQGGEFVAGGSAILQANAGATAWNLIWTSGAQPVSAASQSGQAVNLGQLLSEVVGGGLAAYVNVTANRAIGTVYTNTSGHPLDVHVTIQTGASVGDGCRLLVGGLEISQFFTQAAASAYGNLSATVPVGATYEVTNAVGTNTLVIWDEL